MSQLCLTDCPFNHFFVWCGNKSWKKKHSEIVFILDYLHLYSMILFLLTTARQTVGHMFNYNFTEDFPKNL